MEKFSVGAVLGDTFKLFFRNFMPFFTIALILYGVELAIQLALGTPVSPVFEVGEQPEIPDGWVMAVFFVVGILITFLLSAAITYGTYQDLRGQKAGFGICIGRGFGLILPVLLASVLVVILAGVGMLLLIIPGVIVLIMLYVVIPVVVVERPGAVASLWRSRDLTKGRRWGILGIFLVLFAINIVISLVAGLVLVPTLFADGGVNLAAFESGTMSGIVIGVNLVIECILAVLMAIAPAVVYYHLRREKEGVDIEQIAAVFD